MKRATGTELKGKKFWGPPIWTTIHILAATLRPEDGEVFKVFLESLTRLLPCDICRQNLVYKLQTVPPDPYLTNNEDAFFYTYFLHDMVNESVSRDAMAAGKDKVRESPPYEDVKIFYFDALSQECEGCKFHGV